MPQRLDFRGGVSRQGELGAELRAVRSAFERTAQGVETQGVTPRGTPYKFHMRMAGNGKYSCSKPVTVETTARPLTRGPKSAHVYGAEGMPVLLTTREVRCRKCENCRKAASALWRIRANAETSTAAARGCRTWFGTLTLSPEQHSRVGMACAAVAARDGDDFATFTPEKQFKQRHKVIGRELQLYFKRLRKSVPLRFLCIAEVHKSGLPHYHVLVHEADPRIPLRHKWLKEQWRVGFSDYKLVTDNRAVGYVTKYISKSEFLVRVRASEDYGEFTASAIMPEWHVKPCPPLPPCESGPALTEDAPDDE